MFTFVCRWRQADDNLTSNMFFFPLFLSCWFFWNSFSGSPYVASNSQSPISAFWILGLLSCTIILRWHMTCSTFYGDANSFSDIEIQESLAAMGLHTLNEVSGVEEAHFKIYKFLFTLSLHINRLTGPPPSDRKGALALRNIERRRGTV